MGMTLNRRRVAVLGATGFIGSHLVERLVAEGAQLLAVSRSAERLERLAVVRSDCAVAFCDLRNRDELSRVFRLFRPEVVYHLAAHPDAPESFEQFTSVLEVNGLGLVNALHASVASGAELFVYGDSTKVFGDAQVPYRLSQSPSPRCSYAIVKSAGWQLCQLATSFSDLRVAAIRPTFVYGPRQGRNIISYVTACAAAKCPVRLQGGKQTRDPLYVDDAVAAFAAVPRREAAWGHAIPIGGGCEMAVSAICESVLAALGVRIPVMEDAEPPRATEVWRSSSDNVDAYRLLGWEPRVSFATGLARSVAAWVDDGPAPSWYAPAARFPRVAAHHFILQTGRSLTFAVIDRRSADRPERRATFRGGRRAVDAALGVAPLSVDAAAEMGGSAA